MTVIELDARRRLSFGKIGRKQDTRYIVNEQPDGTLVLTPAAVVPADVAQLATRLHAGMNDIRAGRTVPLEQALAQLGLTDTED